MYQITVCSLTHLGCLSFQCQNIARMPPLAKDAVYDALKQATVVCRSVRHSLYLARRTFQMDSDLKPPRPPCSLIYR